MRHATAVLVLAAGLFGGCARTAPAATATAISATPIETCEQAFRIWVDIAASLNSPDVDLVDGIVRGESVQRRVFELCSLEEAEGHNVKMPLEPLPGITEPMIQPDFRTFAEIECVDESPLLDGTALCAEVAE